MRKLLPTLHNALCLPEMLPVFCLAELLRQALAAGVLGGRLLLLRFVLYCILASSRRIWADILQDTTMSPIPLCCWASALGLVLRKALCRVSCPSYDVDDISGMLDNEDWCI